MLSEFLILFATVLGLEWWLILLLREVAKDTTEENRDGNRPAHAG